MKDPVELPGKNPRRFACINIVTGHVIKEKVMTPMQAVRINNYNHMRDTDYKWLWNDQYDFNDKLVDDARLVPHT